MQHPRRIVNVRLLTGEKARSFGHPNERTHPVVNGWRVNWPVVHSIHPGTQTNRPTLSLTGLHLCEPGPDRSLAGLDAFPKRRFTDQDQRRRCAHSCRPRAWTEVWVAELEDGETGEDEAVMEVATEIGCGSLEIRLAVGGRANLFATELCCVLVDGELLKQLNCTSSIVIATSFNFSYARAGQRVATVKSIPFAVSKSQLEAVISIVRERGPILQARPIRTPCVGVLYTDPLNGEWGSGPGPNGIWERPIERLAEMSTTFAMSLGIDRLQGGLINRWGMVLNRELMVCGEVLKVRLLPDAPSSRTWALPIPSKMNWFTRMPV